MKILVETENCNFENHYLIEASANSVINITLEIPKIVSRQSKKPVIDALTQLIHSELSKFKWIIVGSILVDFLWYLNGVERQETDKVGDLDNIAKPIQDALSGPNGIIVDDSQIGALYNYWLSRNELLSDNVLCISIKFNNDYVLPKNNLKFVQYSNAMCIPVNIDMASIKDAIVAKIIIKSRLRLRKAAKKIKDLGSDIDRYFVCSEHDYHRTRLNLFPDNQILTISQLNEHCIKLGMTIKDFIAFFRPIK
jgi:Holliday junction resolvase RusA-like endonuclease